MGITPLVMVKDGPVVILTINRPDAGNAINLQLAAALREAVSEAIADPGCAAIVIAASGRVFCAGGDLASIAGAADVRSQLREFALTLHEAMALLRESRMVVVAGVAGAAAGAGVACPQRRPGGRGAERAVPRGVLDRRAHSGHGDLLSAPPMVGAHRAAELALLGRTLDAQTAQEWGIVNEVVADSAVSARAAELARTVAYGPRPPSPGPSGCCARARPGPGRASSAGIWTRRHG